MSFSERALRFSCHGAMLHAILSVPQKASSRGVLIVVGGPQYRAGSHRQFTLLARDLAAAGIPVMRFDYRGMGDSEGDPATFENVDEDLRAAIDFFCVELPYLKDIVLWGLCDGASAAIFYAPSDPRVSGTVLLNPWIRTEAGQARAHLKHYYRARLFDGELWKKILRGRFDYAAALRSIADALNKIAGGRALNKQRNRIGLPKDVTAVTAVTASPASLSLPERMREGFSRFEGKTLLIMSGRDLTADEFLDTVSGSRDWQKILHSPSLTRRDLAPADHTFSRRDWRDQIATWSRDWIKSW
jgi:exosortase A-associated hydrolase 1